MKQKEKKADMERIRKLVLKRFWEKKRGTKMKPFLAHCCTLKSFK